MLFQKYLIIGETKTISELFAKHMGYINPFSAGTDFRRQNLTSADVRGYEVDPSTEKIENN